MSEQSALSVIRAAMAEARGVINMETPAWGLNPGCISESPGKALQNQNVKLDMPLPCDPTPHSFWHIHQRMCTRMFTAALIVTAPD